MELYNNISSITIYLIMRCFKLFLLLFQINYPLIINIKNEKKKSIEEKKYEK